MINSPLNYTGNKYKLLSQIMPFLNNQSDIFIDVFAGSGLVGLNSDCKEVLLNDNNEVTISLLNYFKDNSAEKIFRDIDGIIVKYGFTDTFRNGLHAYKEEKHEGLSKYNKIPFNVLKDDYNNNPSVDKLFALIIFGFNHYIRFNSAGLFNVPVGKVDYSKSLREKTVEYTAAFHNKKIEITNYDFREKELYKNKEAIYYFDPPYLITEAPYNASWSERDEEDLLNILDELNEKGIKFALSNVIESNGKVNEILREWSKKYNVNYLDRKYLNSNYRKKNITIAREVLITNFDRSGKMGRSGNTPGYKVFSFNTTVRNPKRNIEFLEVLNDYNGEELTNEVKRKIYYEVIRRGIYRLSFLDDLIIEKYNSGIKLTDEEITRSIKDNPQKTGDEGRVMTQIRAIKDCGFLSFTGNRNHPVMSISPLGKQLLDGYDVENIYTKAMIGLHANNPQRKTIYNESRPFLNTMFIIKGINDYYGNDKGILWHEFTVFVLSMKDCDYEKIIRKIIDYRERNKNKRVKSDLEYYLYQDIKVNQVDFDSITTYGDDVFRKFDMTGLFTKSGFGANVYVRFNKYNITKVNSLLDMYSDYKFETFKDVALYLDYLANVKLPWEENAEVKKQIVEQQVLELGVQIDNNSSLDNQMKELKAIYNKNLFDSSISEYSMDIIKEEVKILSRHSNKKSKFDDIPEPLRLEWLVSMALAKVYGSKFVKPNLDLDSSGRPKSYAAPGKADIEFEMDDFYCLVEVTMMRDYKQQLNSETTSVADHLRSLGTDKEKCSIFVAPYIHDRVVNFYQYTVFNYKLDMFATTIEYFIDIVDKNETIDKFKLAVNEFVSNMKEMDDKKYSNFVNMFRLEE